MKKLLSLFLALLMITSIALVACNGETPDDENNDLAFNQTEPDETGDNNDNNDNNNNDNNDNTDNTPDDYTFTEVDETVYVQNCKSVNIRTSPSDINRDNIAGSLTFGDGKSYKRTGYNSMWSRLEINGETVYIKTYFLTTSSAEVVFTTLSEPKIVYVNNVQEDENGNIVEKSLNIRKFTNLSPDTAYYPEGNVEAIAKHGAQLKVLAVSKDENWYYVEFKYEENGKDVTKLGYVANGPFISETVPTGEPHTEPAVTEPAVG